MISIVQDQQQLEGIWISLYFCDICAQANISITTCYSVSKSIFISIILNKSSFLSLFVIILTFGDIWYEVKNEDNFLIHLLSSPLNPPAIWWKRFVDDDGELSWKKMEEKRGIYPDLNWDGNTRLMWSCQVSNISWKAYDLFLCNYMGSEIRKMQQIACPLLLPIFLVPTKKMRKYIKKIYQKNIQKKSKK